MLSYNDIDEFGEQFSGPKVDYKQPRLFDLAGDPFAYLHNNDDTNALESVNADGDLPISWSLKPALAPEAYGKAVTLTDDMLRAWNQSWQNYYQGKGPKPTMPLVPGADSPKPSTTVVVNLQERADANGKQAPVTNNYTTVTAPASGKVNGASANAKAKVRSARLMRTAAGHRAVELWITSGKSMAQVRVRLYDAKGHKMADTRKKVATNHRVRVSGFQVPKQVKKVTATIVG